jgi:hypothetical protein
MEIGTPLTGPFFNDTVAVPLYELAIFFFVGLPVILKSVIVCLCGALPFNITMLNVALNVGDVEFTFLKSHTPETIQAGFPSFPFSRLAIVPNLEPGDYCAFTIDATLKDIIIATTAATRIIVSGLAIKTCLFFGVIKNTSAKSLINTANKSESKCQR